MRFKVEDRVTLSPKAMALYGAGPNQGAGRPGKVVFAGERPNDPSRPYLVLWESAPEGPPNSYREDDLLPVRFVFGTVNP